MAMIISCISGTIASYIDDESEIVYIICEIAIISFIIELLSIPITIILHILGVF
jgi:hypothetical protein